MFSSSARHAGVESSPEALGPQGGQQSATEKSAHVESSGQVDVFFDVFHRETIDCKTPVTVYGHQKTAKGEGHVWPIPDKPCHAAACSNTWCVARNTRDRAKRVADVYSRLFDMVGLPARYGALVLTLPKQHRTYKKDVLDTLRRRARRVVEKWMLDCSGLEVAPDRGHGWRLAGADVWHPEGDKDPGVWKPHIHLEVVGLAYWSGPLGCSCPLCRKLHWQKIKVRLDKDLDFPKLRLAWGLVLHEVLGWQPSHGDFSRCDVDYKWRTLSSDVFRFFHRIKYDFRHWPGYTGSWRAIRWWGYLSPRSQKTIGLPQRSSVGDRPDVHFNVCPVCGLQSDIFVECGHVKKIDARMLRKQRAPPWMIEIQVTADERRRQRAEKEKSTGF